ncbi:ScbR family autoregulator-binding transcription factor [Streptomyces sp. AM8-1-1]|uniref:ScbR family autoregulator-binding transcription factor n=1 Tax=Streptomyces sp. AM8-1-1 TaxID=3075825 RepID=UPI0028C3D01E|nr:ScbR family autoregulator-binding transcription factor [Streptomyces sp. AM8-1-1]WNO76577.1 ScbR family autoregulator-binding transcription factor [Streptomyces sp. AM8-1-1]
MKQQERAVRTRRALVHSAAEAFQRHGYVQARLAQISADAGVSPGALHFHFENKAALARAVQASAGMRLRRAAGVATRRSGMNALQRLTDTSHALAEQLRTDVVARAGYRLSCEQTRTISHHGGQDLCGQWQTYVQQQLTEAARHNLLTEAAIPHETAASIVAATTGLETLARHDATWLSHETLTNWWELALRCLATPTTLPALRAAGTGTPRPPHPQ